MTAVMKGWETFNAVPGATPPISRALTGRLDWPDSEVHGGVACIQITSYGDSIGGAFVSVCGPDHAAVEACFARTVAALDALLGVVWP